MDLEKCEFCWVYPVLVRVSVCVSLSQWGGLGNYLFGILGQRFMRPRGSYWNRAGGWLSDPRLPLYCSSLSLSLFFPGFIFLQRSSHPFFVLLTRFYGHAYKPLCFPICNLSYMEPLKETKMRSHQFEFSFENQSGMAAWVCWIGPVSPFQVLEWRHAAIYSLT